jgi:hypothetical protein
MASLSLPPGKGARGGEDDGVQLQELPPGLLVPTPLSPSGLSEVGTEADLGRAPASVLRQSAGGAGEHPEPISGGVGQKRRREGALHHFRGRNVLCLNGRCVFGKFDVGWHTRFSTHANGENFEVFRPGVRHNECLSRKRSILTAHKKSPQRGRTGEKGLGSRKQLG